MVSAAELLVVSDATEAEVVVMGDGRAKSVVLVLSAMERLVVSCASLAKVVVVVVSNAAAEEMVVVADDVSDSVMLGISAAELLVVSGASLAEVVVVVSDATVVVADVISDSVVLGLSAPELLVVSDVRATGVDGVLDVAPSDSDVGSATVEIVVVVLTSVVQIPPESGDAPGGQTQLFPDEAGTLSAVHTQFPLLSAVVPDGQVHPPAPSSTLSAGHTQTPGVASKDFGGTQLTRQVFCQKAWSTSGGKRSHLRKQVPDPSLNVVPEQPTHTQVLEGDNVYPGRHPE
ncbi:hypothetical protein HDU88_005290 [Geranomyces variabilis]|nr:hypothetical protein HDU88_005290 [Geranomyces variabilis]